MGGGGGGDLAGDAFDLVQRDLRRPPRRRRRRRIVRMSQVGGAPASGGARLRFGGREWVASQARRQLGGFQTETSGGQGLGSDGQAAGAEERGRR